jgi:predicted transposase YbfD/YdcC
VSRFADAVRKHWSIENQLHWQLDVTFGEDGSRAKKDNAPLNLNVLRKTSLALLKAVDWGRIGLKKKMFIAALNPDKLLQVFF